MKIIMLSASANKLLRLKEQAEEYAALIMEELDPERLGYIEVGPLYIWDSDFHDQMFPSFALCVFSFPSYYIKYTNVPEFNKASR